MLGPFAQRIFEDRYRFNSSEQWPGCAARVARFTCPDDARLEEQVRSIIESRKLMPGGRYLYSSGRPLAPQLANCFLFKCNDSAREWGNLLRLVTIASSKGGGCGVEYSGVRPKGSRINGYGGTASGPVSTMKMVNEAGRHMKAGAQRRAALWAGLNWQHDDVREFIHAKEWSDVVRSAKAADPDFPASLDQTNISVGLDDEFFRRIVQPGQVESMPDGDATWRLYLEAVRLALRTSEPGFSINLGDKSRHVLRNACVTPETEVLTDRGYCTIESVVGEVVLAWNGERWSRVTPKLTGRDLPVVEVQLSDGTSLRCTHYHEWILQSGERVEAGHLKEGDALARFRMPVIEGGEDSDLAYTHGFFCGDGHQDRGRKYVWLYSKKRFLLPRLEQLAVGPQSPGRLLVRLPDSLPEKFWVPGPTWSVTSRVDWLAGLLDADGAVVRAPNSKSVQLGSVNLEFLLNVRKLLTTLGVQAKVRPMRDAGERMLPDGRGGMASYSCLASHRLQITPTDVVKLVDLGMRCSRLDLSENYPQRDARRFVRVERIKDVGTSDVYCFNEPLDHRGTFNGIVTGQCTEVDSRDHGDVCNLASVNFARVESIDELEEVCWTAAQMLFRGTIVGWLPDSLFEIVRNRSRRLGVGILGLHEWCLQRGLRYGPSEELGRWLDCWAEVTDAAARDAAKHFGLPEPRGVRAVAPTGTIGILAETTTGIEPIFASAYKRRFQDRGQHKFQYVVDPTAKRLVDAGVPEEEIEDAHSLSRDLERRLVMQAFVQARTDQAISSTINIPKWGEEGNRSEDVERKAALLLRYLPRLRGVTFYADGSRTGQPLEPVSISEALESGDRVHFEAEEEACATGSCGI